VEVRAVAVAAVTDPAASRVSDLVKRCFTTDRPDALWGWPTFTYVPMTGGWFTYTAFVIDAFAGLIVGWECATTKHVRFVQSAIRQTVGDAYDNALAETTIGPYKTECIIGGTPFRRGLVTTLADAEHITLNVGGLAQQPTTHAPPRTNSPR
jgi:transposase InsO family protein